MGKFVPDPDGFRKLEQRVKKQSEGPLNASLAKHRDKPEAEAAKLLRQDMRKVWMMSQPEALAIVRKARN